MAVAPVIPLAATDLYRTSGPPVAHCRVASVLPSFDPKQANEWRDGEGPFLPRNVWRQQTGNVCESLTRGTWVVVTGRIEQRSYETKEGDKRTVLKVEADGWERQPRPGREDPGASEGPGGYSDGLLSDDDRAASLCRCERTRRRGRRI